MRRLHLRFFYYHSGRCLLPPRVSRNFPTLLSETHRPAAPTSSPPLSSPTTTPSLSVMRRTFRRSWLLRTLPAWPSSTPTPPKAARAGMSTKTTCEYNQPLCCFLVLSPDARVASARSATSSSIRARCRPPTARRVSTGRSRRLPRCRISASRCLPMPAPFTRVSGPRTAPEAS